MIIPVRLYTDPLLSAICKPVMDLKDPALEPLIQDMFESMVAFNGVGLAANQVGIDKAICVVDLEGRTKKMVLINPTIIERSKKKTKLSEACLSCPGMSVNKKRADRVVVESDRLDGELATYVFEGYDAKIVQHEIDHLNGINLSHTLVKPSNSCYSI